AVVGDAVKALKKQGVDASGRVLATRKATKRIVAEAERLGCNAIVMAADPPRSRLVADLMWSQEPYRVQRRAKVPVHLVTPASGGRRPVGDAAAAIWLTRSGLVRMSRSARGRTRSRAGPCTSRTSPCPGRGPARPLRRPALSHVRHRR